MDGEADKVDKGKVGKVSVTWVRYRGLRQQATRDIGCEMFLLESAIKPKGKAEAEAGTGHKRSRSLP